MAFLGYLTIGSIDLVHGLTDWIDRETLTGRASMVLHYGGYVLTIKVVLHHCCIRALGKLSSFLDSTLIENSSHSKITAISAFIRFFNRFLFGHNEAFDCRLLEFLLDLLLELYQLNFYFWNNVPFLFQWAAS